MAVLVRLLLILLMFVLIVFMFKRLLTGEQQHSIRSYVKIIAFALLAVSTLALLSRLFGLTL